MKKSGIILMILLLGASLPTVDSKAQKISKIEKLLEYAIDNDTVKFQKNREKLDQETLDYYPDEVELVDAMHRLWFEKQAEAIPQYLAFYQPAMDNSFQAICDKGKIDVAQVRTRSDYSMLDILAASPDKLTLSRQLLDTIAKKNYPIQKNVLDAVYGIREEALFNLALQQPAAQSCELYLKEFPRGRFLYQVVNRYDDILLQSVQKNPTPDGFKRYFGNSAVNTFFGQPDNRKSIANARALYDDYLYQLILRPQELPALKAAIDAYRTDSLLGTSVRRHLTVLEYKADSVDYELLKSQVTGADKLSLIKDYLLTHRYKEFRDKANALRTAFEDHVIRHTPAYTYSYSKGKLLKATETDPNQTLTSTYTYDDKGGLKRVETSVQRNGQGTLLITAYTLDANGRCTLETRTDSVGNKLVYRRASTYSPAGTIQSDSIRYDDGRVVLRNYNAAGCLTAEKEYNKDKLVHSATLQYNTLGQLEKSEYSYSAPDSVQPDYVISLTESCEYDAYGYLKQRLVEKTLVNNVKTQSILACLYDAYGNSIDSNAFYEYDHTGRWVRKTDGTDPNRVEYVQCIYK